MQGYAGELMMSLYYAKMSYEMCLDCWFAFMDEAVLFAGDMPSHPCNNAVLRFIIYLHFYFRYASTIRKILAAKLSILYPV